MHTSSVWNLVDLSREIKAELRTASQKARDCSTDCLVADIGCLCHSRRRCLLSRNVLTPHRASCCFVHSRRTRRSVLPVALKVSCGPRVSSSEYTCKVYDERLRMADNVHHLEWLEAVRTKSIASTRTRKPGMIYLPLTSSVRTPSGLTGAEPVRIGSIFPFRMKSSASGRKLPI